MECYEALSYTWKGKSSSSKVIVSQTHAISITKNLENALRRFRLADRPRRLWINALSINQNDDKEKSHQIPLMTDIYRGAATVLVWLGRDARVEASLGRLSDPSRPVFEKNWDGLSVLAYQDEAVLKACISDVINVRWFSRRWIIQEVVLNSNVILNAGFKQISFIKFMSIVKTLKFDPHIAPSKKLTSAWALFHLWESFNTQQQQGDREDWFFVKYPYKNDSSSNMLRLMRIFNHFGCADGRDRIITIASLASDIFIPRSSVPLEESPQSILLPMPYERSVQETYVKFAEFVFNSGNIHWVLSQAAARVGSLNDPALPTWVPDWRVEGLRLPFRTECDNIIMLRYVDREMDIISNDKDLNTSDCENLRRLAGNGGTQLEKMDDLQPSITGIGQGIHQLRARMSCIQHCPGPSIDISASLGTCESKVPLDLHIEPLKWCYMGASEEHLYPHYVDWKSPEYKASMSAEDVLVWVKTVFHDIWARVIPPASHLSIDLLDDDAVGKSEIASKLLKKLDYVLTAGRMFINHLSSREGDCMIAAKDHVYTLRGILARTNNPKSLDFPEDLYLRLVALTVRGRCLITCESDSMKSTESDGMVLGLGPSHVEIGDRVTCIHGEDYKESVASQYCSRIHLFRTVPENSKIDPIQTLHASGEKDKSPTMKFIGDCFLTISDPSWNSDWSSRRRRLRDENKSPAYWRQRDSGKVVRTTITLI